MKYTDALADQHDQFLDVQWEKARLLGLSLEEYIATFIEKEPEPVKGNPSTLSTGIDWSIT